jgi:hypothetical protein
LAIYSDLEILSESNGGKKQEEANRQPVERREQ